MSSGKTPSDKDDRHDVPSTHSPLARNVSKEILQRIRDG